MRLAGKTALVTGSSQGIGEAVALRLADEGADVVVHYRSHPEGAHGVVERIAKLGRRTVAIQADLSRVTEVQRLIADGVTQLGPLDILVNNAGVEKRADFWDVSETDYDFVMNVNLKGLFFTTQAFVRHLLAAKRPGRIINMSSVHEELPFPHFTTYCMSKGGVKMMTRNLAIELAPFGITINSIAPGAIETPINRKLLNDPEKLRALIGNIPLKRLGKSSDIAGVAAFLASSDADYRALIGNIPLKRLGKSSDIAGVAAFLASSDADYITGTTIVTDGGLLWNYEEQ